MELELRINGVIESLDIAPNEGLFSLLRREGYCGVKHGCETGECGACTVLVEGVPRPSCVMLAAQVNGCTLTTVEGLSSGGKLHPLQATFAEMGATPCGFCTPGMLISAYELLKRNPSPTADDVRDALSGNLCRCSGYDKPVQAVLRAAAIVRGEKIPVLEYSTVKAPDVQGNFLANLAQGAASATTKMPALKIGQEQTKASAQEEKQPQFQAVGKALPMRNALKMVQGKAAFVADVQMRDMLYTRILTSPHAHALIRSIDTSRARALPGVHAVLTYKDLPRSAYTSIEQFSSTIQDQYSLDYMLRYAGDKVAVIAAETPDIAEQALQLISVDYEVLPAILDVRHGLAPNASVLHPETESRGIYDAKRNIAARMHEEIGNVEQGFAQADLVVESEYVISPSQSTPIENHTVMAYFDEDDFLVIRTNSQVPHLVRRTLAKLIGLSPSRIRIITPEAGGSFGVKHELGGEDLAAFLAIITRHPVLLETPREETLSSRIRAQHILRVKTGVKQDGTIVASQMALLADTGAHGTHPFVNRGVDGKSALLASKALALYPSANMQFVAEVLYTNHPPAAAFVGNGEIQAFFALESHIDEVAQRLNMDALAFRKRNMIVAGAVYPFSREGSAQGTTPTRNAPPFIENNGLVECIRLVEEKIQWRQQRALHQAPRNGRLRRGTGIALALHGYAGAPLSSGAIMKMNEDGSFDVFVDIHDGGLGATTMIAQVIAEVLGIPVEDVYIHTSEIEELPFASGGNGVNGLTAIIGAVQRAAELARRQILTTASRMLNVLPEALHIVNGNVVDANGQKVPLSRIAEHTFFVEQRQIITTASWKAPYLPTACSAQGVEVEVDIETGYVRVLKVVSAVDVGTAINPMLIENQVHGYVIQGLGLALSEELIYDTKGVSLTPNLHDYHIFAASDKVEVQALLVETTTSIGAFSMNAIAEVIVSGIVPAIANAIADATGIRLRHVPFTPERVLRALHAQTQAQSATQKPAEATPQR